MKKFFCLIILFLLNLWFFQISFSKTDFSNSKKYIEAIENLIEKSNSTDFLKKIIKKSDEILYSGKIKDSKKSFLIEYLNLSAKEKLEKLSFEKKLDEIKNPNFSDYEKKYIDKNIFDILNKLYKNFFSENLDLEFDLKENNNNISWKINLNNLLEKFDFKKILENKNIFEVYKKEENKYFLKPSFYFCEAFYKNNCQKKFYEKLIKNFEIFLEIEINERKLFIDFKDYFEINLKIIFDDKKIKKLEFKANENKLKNNFEGFELFFLFENQKLNWEIKNAKNNFFNDFVNFLNENDDFINFDNYWDDYFDFYENYKL